MLRYLFWNLCSISMFELDAINPDGFKDCLVQQQLIFGRQSRFAASRASPDTIWTFTRASHAVPLDPHSIASTMITAREMYTYNNAVVIYFTYPFFTSVSPVSRGKCEHKTEWKREAARGDAFTVNRSLLRAIVGVIEYSLGSGLTIKIRILWATGAIVINIQPMPHPWKPIHGYRASA